MFRNTGLGIGVLAFAMLMGTAQAAGEIDRRFGDAGTVRLALQPVDGQSHDVGVVACARPDGTLFAAGLASGGARIVSAWFTERGALDLRYSDDGKTSFAIGPGVPYTSRGVCLPDSGALIIAEMVDAQGEGSLHLWRLDTTTGQLDPDYGVAGLRVLDLDDHASDLGQYETPRSLSPGRDGDVLLGGVYSLGSQNDRNAGFLARIDARGTVRAVSLAHQWNPQWEQLGPTGVAADGMLWSGAVRSGVPVTGALLRLDYDTLAYRDTLHAQISVDFTPVQAVMLGGETMALAGVRRGGKPLVALLQAGTLQVVQPPLPAGYATVQNVQIAALPGARLLFAGAAKDADDRMRAMAFARLRIAPDSSLQVDPSFGDGGAWGSVFPPPAACAGHDTEEVFRRFTYWKGRPTAIGAVDVACPGSAQDFDWLLLRLDLERVFRDGFGADD
jgi:hypothetical protein